MTILPGGQEMWLLGTTVAIPCHLPPVGAQVVEKAHLQVMLPLMAMAFQPKNEAARSPPPPALAVERIRSRVPARAGGEREGSSSRLQT